MTHGPSSSNKRTEDYQTLEFLGNFELKFHISRELEEQSHDISIIPRDLSKKRSILISNNVLAWFAVQNNFHQYLRIDCPFAKSRIAVSINLVDEIETKINVPRENYKQEKEYL